MFENFTLHYLNIQYLFGRIYFAILRMFDPAAAARYSGAPSAPVSPAVGSHATRLDIFLDFILQLKVLFFIFSLLLVFGIIYCIIRLREINKKNEFVFAEMTPDQHIAPRAEQWEKVLLHVGSENPSDWKLAVLEADTILDELLKSLQIPGATVGEQLKNANPGDFKSLNDAWEGHKVRNRIAHEGLNFGLTKREARRAIEQFERVFKEFKLI